MAWTKNSNILLSSDAFPPVMDGVAVCVQNYAYWMQKKVGGVSVITPNVYGTDYKSLDYRVLDYLSVPVPFRKPYVAGVPPMDPVFMARLTKQKFKIVHAHSPFMSGLMAATVAKTQGIPLVATFHSKFRDDYAKVVPSGFVVDQMLKATMEFFERADEVWVPQESVVDVIREYGFKGPVEVVENGSDLVADYPDSYFADARKALGIGPEEFVFLFVGQHIWQKNVRFIIDGLEKIKDLKFKMFFVGTGPAADEMKDLVREKGLDGHVTFTGMLTNRDDITRYYAAADLFLFPSLYDNAPLVVREAAALHTPSVMIDESTASTILKDGENGFLVPNNLDAFVARLRELLADPERVHRVGVQASRSIVRSWEDVVGEVLDRYNRLISKKTLISVQ
jgi:glycosyltransferase involved in cell wall biosynthesis